MRKIGILSLAATTAIMASGWKVPEQSVNSTALAGAYVANAYGADAAYYNPANMAFMEQGSYAEVDLTYVHLTEIDYDGVIASKTPVTGTPRHVPAGASSKKENFLLPTGHYVGRAYDKFRFGISLTVPGGLSKRWTDGGASTLVAKEFTLEVMELNPVASYKVTDNFAVAAGFRFVRSKGVVQSSGVTVADLSAAGGGPGEAITLTRNMAGSDLSVGANFAVSYKPLKEMTLAVTYRTKVDMKVNGNATLSSQVAADTGGFPAGTPLGAYSDEAEVTVPLPAVWSLATAYTFFESTTVELEYERVYWSAYSTLDFDYPEGTTGSPILDSAFNRPSPRNWDDTNTYRIGITHELNETWTLMAGFAYDETPAPTNTISYELPDSDAKIYSLGARYHYSKEWSFGLAALYDQKDDVNVNQPEGLTGEFTNASAYLVTIGASYSF